MLIVAGPFSPKKILPKIEESFAPLSKADKPPEPNIVEPAQAGERRVELRIPSEADYIKVAYHTPGFGNEDVYGLMMLDAVLSGVRLFAFGPGQTSGRSARLYRALVEKKIATQASSEFFPTIDPSVFALDLTVWDGVNIDKAEKLLFEEIEKVKTSPPSRHELDRSLAQIRSQYSYTFDGVARQGFVIGIFEQVISFETVTKLVIRGSRKMGPEKIADSLESVGAAISFRNTADAILFQARMTTPWMKRVLDILSECLTRPSFERRDVEKEKEELLTDIRLRDDDPTRRGIRELVARVYPKNHPYSQDKFGTAESVKKIERAGLVDYFDDHVAKAPVIIAFAGQFKSDQALKWSGRTFGEREDSSKMKSVSGAPRNPSRKEIVMPHKAQTEIMMGALAVARLDPDYEPLNLLNAILGELGFMGRLGQRVRDKEGLAYSCTSFLNAGLQGGNWTALAGVNPKNVDRARRLMDEEIKRVIDEPVLDQELEDAKENQTGSALMELESTEGIARTSHNLVHYGLGLDYFAKRRQLFRKINVSQLQEMAGKYLQPSRTSSVIVGPKAKT